MPNFKFRLQPVLAWRERVEQQKQTAMAATVRSLESAKERLAHLEFSFASEAELLRRGHKAFDVDALRHHYAHLEYLTREIKLQQVRVAACEAEVDQARHILVMASRDRKVIERLKVRKREAHDADQALVEQKEADDSNARRFSRRAPSLGSSI